MARAQAVAGLCRLAGVDEDAIPRWIEEGRRTVSEILRANAPAPVSPRSRAETEAEVAEAGAEEPAVDGVVSIIDFDETPIERT